MSCKCGIIGLPNVGKSTLFNALTSTLTAEVANYPFCTIEPNLGTVFVPDERVENLTQIAKSKKAIHATMEFVDIAGLVKNASKGDGLGNKFLGHIREVDAILHVLRCFKDDNVTHVHGKVSPLDDAEVVETELILADIESAEKRIKKNSDINEVSILKHALEFLHAGKPARELLSDGYKYSDIKKLQLITSKPILYVCNVDEDSILSGNEYSRQVNSKLIISSKIEAEIAAISENERKDFLKSIGIESSGLDKIIKASYELLGLASYFTVGVKETRAWTFPKGTNAQNAAGIIHTDFAKGFIRAEVTSYEDFMKYGSLCKENGKTRLEGKEYIVQDGDIIHFRFNN